MGRISKRHASGTAVQKKETARKVYKTAVYARLSVDTDARKNESIDTQVEIAKDYIRNYNEKHSDKKMEIFDIYRDLGKTGTNFERDDFQRMLQDIRLGDVNCVIVKDLSRFGREYMDVGDYIDNIFPFLGVRFIAIADNFDTEKKECREKRLSAEIKNLTNDMYAKDFSKKAKLSHKQRREAGSYTGGFAPYGYKVEKEGRTRRLVLDEQSAGIVRMIYEKFLEYGHYQPVVVFLNTQKVNCPSVYRRTGKLYYSGDGEYIGWTSTTLRSILASEAYCGDLVLGKWESSKPEGISQRMTSEENWVQHKDTHEAIVSREFDGRVKALIKEISRKHASLGKRSIDMEKPENVFGGIIFCGECGHPMTRDCKCRKVKSGSGIWDEYRCDNSINRAANCTKGTLYIPRRTVEEVVLESIRKEFSLYLSLDKALFQKFETQVEEKKSERIRMIWVLKDRERRLHERLTDLYLEFHDGAISEENYKQIKEKLSVEMNGTLAEIREQEEKNLLMEKDRKKCSRMIRAVLKLKSENILTGELVGTLIQRINVYQDKRIEIIFDHIPEMEGGGR